MVATGPVAKRSARSFAMTRGMQDIATGLRQRVGLAVDEGRQSVGERAQAVLARAGSCALFIDIDGTLLGVAPTPNSVYVPSGLVPLLDGVRRGLGGAMAVLTGRRIADVDRLFAPLCFVASGVHGTELRADPGAPITTLAPEIPSSIVQAMSGIRGMAPGVLVEPKGCGVAVHYRNAPLAQRALESDVAAILASSSYDLVLRKGRKVLEAVPRGYSKGTALTAIIASMPFKGRRPVMIGDDVGDESALEAAERLGGVGLRVAGEHFSAEEADFGGVESVRAWLRVLSDQLAARGATVATA
jgi:trehalose 6-phosphate phosphatase